MGQYNPNRIFKPRHVAVVGASEKAGAMGNALIRNNPEYQTMHGLGVLRIGFRPGDGCGPGGYRHADSYLCRYRRRIAVNLNASFASEMPAAGNLAFVSQSGAICTAILEGRRSHRLLCSFFRQDYPDSIRRIEMLNLKSSMSFQI